MRGSWRAISRRNGGFGDCETCTEFEVVIEAASMIRPLRDKNLVDQNMPTTNLFKKVREVKGSKCRGNELAEIVAVVANELEYEVGDMVWAKIKSYPWWPGHIFKEDWAVPSVLTTKKEGQVLVAFFGDNSYGWFDPKELKPFDTHYVEKSKQAKLSAFLDAVEDAEDEVSRRAALGLACWCNNLLSMRPLNYFDWFYDVNIKGYDSSGVYSMKQIKRARDEFQPVVALSFIRQLALMPGGKEQRDVDWIKNVAVVCAYRKAVFEEIDETFILSYGDQAEKYNYSTTDLEQLQKDVSFQAPQSRSIEVSEAVGQTMKLAQSIELTNRLERETCTSKQHEKAGCTSRDREVVLGLAKYERYAQITPKMFSNNNTNSGGLETQSRSIMKVVETRYGNEVDLVGQGLNSCHMTLSLEGLLPGKAFEDVNHIVDAKQDDLEHPRERLTSEKAIMVDNKKRKREVQSQGSETHQHKIVKDGTHESLKINSMEKSGQIISSDKGKALTSQHQKENKANHMLSSHSVVNKQVLGLVRTEAELYRIYADLLALGLNPYHGVEQNIPSNVEKFVLQFRSVAYQKSHVASLSVEKKSGEVKCKSSDFSASTVPVKSHLTARALSLPLDSIPPKKRLKPDGYPMTCQQSGVHDDREEISQRDKKWVNKSKALSAEERARNPMDIKSRNRNQEKTGAVHVVSEVKHLPEKPATRVESAKTTVLIVRFPSKSALPSFSELKAKFVRFGPLHLSATHVSWKSSTCIVAFKCQSDALAAYNHATQNKFLFGNANVHYQLQASEIPPLQSQTSGDQLVNQTYGKDLPLPIMITRALAEPMIQQKTHQKKPQADVTRHIAVMPSQNPSLTFLVDESGSGNKEQLVIRNSVKCSNYDNLHVNNLSPSSTLSISIDPNLQPKKFTGPLHALPVGISNITGDFRFDKSADLSNDRSSQSAGMNTMASAPTQGIDISQQMLSNLIRCNEIINNLKSALGFVPLHL